MSDRPRAFGYVRVSTEEQALLGTSVAAQKAHVRALCEARGWELVEVFVDAGISGGKPISERPAGRRLLAALGKGDVVVALKLDRLFRNVLDAVTRVDEWAEEGVQLAVDGIDTTTPSGRVMFIMNAAFAELERNRIKERTRAVAAYRQSQSLVVGQVPMGAKVAGDGKTLIPNEAELDVLDRIRSLRNERFSFGRIADILNSEGAPKKRGGTWTRGAVHHLYHAHISTAPA